MITNFRQVQACNINWDFFGTQMKSLRESGYMSLSQIAKALHLEEKTVLGIERGNRPKKTRRSTVIVWKVFHKCNVSLNWLLNGIGNPHDEDPIELLPETLIIERGKGIRLPAERIDSEEGNYVDETLEFVMAIDKFRHRNQVPFPSLTQLYEIILALGYRKSVPAKISPLGYKVKQQMQAEEMKPIEEPEECETFVTEPLEDDLRTLKTKTVPLVTKMFSYGGLNNCAISGHEI